MIKGLVSGIVGIIVFVGLIVVINAVVQHPDTSSQAGVSQPNGVESDADVKQPLAENDPYFSAHDVEQNSASQPPQMTSKQGADSTTAQGQQTKQKDSVQTQHAPDAQVALAPLTEQAKQNISQGNDNISAEQAPDLDVNVGTHSAPPPKPVPYSKPSSANATSANNSSSKSSSSMSGNAKASQRDMLQSTDTAHITYRDQLQPSHINVLIDAEQQSSVAAQQVLQAARKMTLSERTMIKGSSWDYVNAVYERAGVSAKQRRTVYAEKYDGGPYADSRLLKPADWLYFVNASHHNSEHSALFIGWTDLHSKQALMLTYDNTNAQPAQYRVFDLSRVYGIVRP